MDGSILAKLQNYGLNSNALKYRSRPIMGRLQRPPIVLLPRAAKCLRPALSVLFSFSIIIANHLSPSTSTGVDLSKILGGLPKYWGEKVVKSAKCMGDSQLLEGHVSGLPPP